MQYFIGIMSGTSLDGVDAVLIREENQQYFYQAHVEEALPEALRLQLLALNSQGFDELARAQIASIELAKISASAVKKLLQQENLQAAQIKALAYHGQTVRHQPNHNPPYSIQIHQAALLAELSQITVITDFRSRDIAAGGQGAPLAPLFQRPFFAEEEALFILNIGGITNFTLLEQNSARGYDCGPGNILMNAWIKKNFQLDFDCDGSWARQGKLIPELLSKLLKLEFFKRLPPKSTGRDDFSLQIVEKFLTGTENPVDVQATLLELTAFSVAEVLRQEALHLEKKIIYLSGGGAKNLFLVQRLQELLFDFEFKDLPMPAQALEGAGFAWLGAQCLAGNFLNLQTITGGKTRILGAIYPA